jgi:hypothetical protein
LVGALQWLAGADFQFAPHLPGQPRHPKDEARSERQRDLLAVGLRYVHQLQEPLLGALIEAQDPIPP